MREVSVDSEQWARDLAIVAAAEMIARLCRVPLARARTAAVALDHAGRLVPRYDWEPAEATAEGRCPRHLAP